MEHASTSSSTYTGPTSYAHTTGRAKRRGVEWSTSKPLEMTPTAFAGEGKLVVDVLRRISEFLRGKVARQQRVVTRKDDVIEAEVKDGGEGGAVDDDSA